MSTSIKQWLPVVVYVVLIFYLSSIPGPQVPTPGGVDLSPIHIPLFFGLSYLIFRALERKGATTAIILAILLSTIYGVLDEVHQTFVPGRDFNILDITFNFIGSSLILLKFWKKATLSIRFRGRIIRL